MSVDFSRTGSCIGCGTLVEKHFDPESNRFLGCTFALDTTTRVARSRRVPPNAPRETRAYLTAKTAAQEYDWPSARAFRAWAQRRQVPAVRFGPRTLRYARVDIERAKRLAEKTATLQLVARTPGP